VSVVDFWTGKTQKF